MSTSREWLSEEDFKCYQDRLSRLDWLIGNSPGGEYWTFPGGLLAKSLFEEARYCFVYAQFLATIFLGLAYIERTLGALFYGAGHNDFQRASLAILLEEAHAKGLLGDGEYQGIERIRKNRNAYAHFRRPEDESSIEARAILENVTPYEIIEQDSTAVLTTVLHLVSKNTSSVYWGRSVVSHSMDYL